MTRKVAHHDARNEHSIERSLSDTFKVVPSRAVLVAIAAVLLLTGRSHADTRSASARRAGKLRADRGFVRAGHAARNAMVRTAERLRTRGASRRPTSAGVSREERVAREIERILRGPLRNSVTSLFVADARTGERLFSVLPDDHLNPASNVKLIATAAALDLLGPDYRYPTRLLGETPGPNGHVENDLYLLGAYDPTLSLAGIRDIAQQLAGTGVTRIAGDIIVGGSRSRDGVFKAAIESTIRATAPGEPPDVIASPASSFVDLEIEATTARGRRPHGRLVTTSEWHVQGGRQRLHVTVSGEIGRARQLTRTVWSRDRALWTALLLHEALRDAGVEVAGGVHVAELRDYVAAGLAHGFIPVPLAEHRSQPLSSIVARVNKLSTNWLADRIIMTAAAQRYRSKPSMKGAVDAMYEWLSQRGGFDRDDLVVDTGSGLSYRTEISARQIVQVLRAGLGLTDCGGRSDARAASLQAYRASLAVGGKDGTIRRRFRRLDGTVIGKTGTLRRVIALSGVLEVNDRHVVFSIITNGHKPSRRARVRRAHDRIVALLCGYLHQQR